MSDQQDLRSDPRPAPSVRDPVVRHETIDAIERASAQKEPQ